MNKQRKTSNILNVFQYDDTTGIIGLNGVPVSGYGLYLHTNINDGSVGIDSSSAINAMYLLKSGTKNFEISYDTSGTSKIFRLLPYQSGSFFQIGNPSNAGADYVFIAESTYGNVLIGPGIGNATGNLTGATALTHKVQIHGATFHDSTVQATGFIITGGASTGFLKADGTVDSATYITGSALTGYATQSYVGTQIANLVAAAPTTLDTLNELAAALGNDPSFATTITTSIGTKVPQTRTITINGTSYDLSANRSWTINSMVYPSAGIALSTGTAWGTSITDNSSNWNTAYGWGNHASGGYLTSAAAATTYVSLTGSYANPAWITSLAYSKLTGVPAFLTSYTETDPYRVTSVAVTGTSTKTITITRADASTVTTTWTDIDTDTNTYVTSAAFSGGTLTLTRNDAGTVTVSLDGRYYLASNPSGYITGITSANVTTALGYTPYNSTNPSGYITGITSSMVTTALGYTPYNSSNPSGYITSYTETDTLASVTGRGATTTSAITINKTGTLISHAGMSDAIGYNASYGTYIGSPVGGTYYIYANGQMNNNGTIVTLLHTSNYSSTLDGRYLYATSNPSTAGNFTLSIGNNGSYSYVQSHSGQPLELNPVGNTVRISGNVALHAGNYNSYSPTLTGGNASGTWSINVTGSAGSISGYNNPTTGATANTIVYRDGGGHITGNYGFYNYINTGDDTSSTGITYIMAKFGDNYHRSATAAKVQSFLGLGSMAYASTSSYVPYGNWGTDSGLNDNRLYLRTSGDTNHYLWNAVDDWEELGAYAGTGFRVTSSNGATGLLYVYGGSNGGYTYSPYSFRAPIFYDSNDTTYFGDFNDQSRMYRLNLSSGQVQAANNAGGRLRISSFTNGESVINGNTHNIVLGPASTRTGDSLYYAGIAINGLMNYTGSTAYDVSPHIWIGGYYRDTPGSERSDFVVAVKSGIGTSGAGSDLPEVRFRVDYNGIASATGSFRAPIFYDSDDTGYYADFNSTSSSAMRIRGGALFGPNTTWGAYLRIGSNGNTDYSHASVVTTNGNLHMDPASSCHMYLNYYVNGNIYLNGSTYYISSNGSYYNGTASYANSAGSASTASYASHANYLDTNYVGGVQSNPQVYFNNGIGLKVAMTGAWSTWSDTVWVNGYTGGDVPWMCAMHFLRNSEPRMAISAQTQGSTGYGTYYEVYTDYNVGSKRTNALKLWATSHPNDYYIVNNWTGSYWQLTTNHGSPVQVGYADNSGSTSQREYNYLRINSNNNLYLDYNYGCSIVGVYSSYRYQGVFSMGDSWKLAIDGTSPGNLYGLSWSHPNAGGQASRLNDHGLMVMINGVTQAAISSNIWAAGDITAYSDARVKENVEVIENALEKVQSIRGVTFTRNDMTDTTTRHAGVIAQEVLEVLPEVITKDANDHYSVAYGNLNALLIEAIKEQSSIISKLTERLEKLENN